jgi:sugar lactone lactonase YvrE
MKMINVPLVSLVVSLLALLVPIEAKANTGDLYVTDNESIQRFEPNGTRHVFASGLFRPRGLAFDGLGNLFVATLDTAFRGDNRGQILKFAPDGTVTVFAAGAGLKSPEGLTFDDADNLYVATVYFSPSVFPGLSPLANAGAGRVLKIAPNGEIIVWHLDPTTYHENFGIVVDGDDNLLVADNLQSGIYGIGLNGGNRTFISVPDPVGLAFDDVGNLYTSQPSLGRIIRMAQDGTSVLLASGLGDVRGLAVDPNGNLFAASPFFGPGDDGHNAVYKITSSGSVSIFATRLDVPQFLAVEP